MAGLADEEDLLVDRQNKIKEELKVGKWLSSQPISSEEEIAKNLSSEFNINLSQAKKQLEGFPNEYTIQNKSIPEIVKELRMHRRTLKGDYREKMTKSIETLVFAYGEHLDSCIKSIYWLSPYEYALKNMRYVEQDLKKIHSVKDVDTRREIVDTLCKFWELDINRREGGYNSNYSKLSKEMTKTKKEFRSLVKSINNTNVKKSLKIQTEEFILNRVCENPGISSRELHDSMSDKLYKRNSSHIISKMMNGLGITTIEGKNFKLTDDIQKDLYAYTASFIDSDGYITMDTNFNPRVGLVATGDRGKAFMVQIQKELGIGKLHLDQKSPQNTRPVNRLNFYSQKEVSELLTKCMPHFRMKGKNAELLLELIKMKQGFKKTEWYRPRMEEIFKLMKWENHKDHVGYDFSKYGIDPTTVAKLHDNCKMDLMSQTETIATPILKSENLEDMFNELKLAAKKGRLENKNFDGKKWWNEQIPTIEERFGKKELDYKWNIPIKDKKVNLDDKSDDFEGDKAKPSHFYNQLVRIPQRKDFTPEAIMQIAINVGFGQAVGSVKKDFEMSDFIKNDIQKEELPYGLTWFAKGNNPKKFLLDKDGVRHAAGAAVFKGDKILIVERSPEEDSMIGMWEFAGGKIEEVDEFNTDGTPNAEKVCMIEVGEELGLKKKPTSLLGVHFDKNMNPPKKYHCFRIDVEDEWNPTLSFEHSDFKWISVEELKDMPDNKLSHHARYVMQKV
tara:strand:+ start:41833 stop:44025 length:2193 start_codon:yes stop_codon:yes gene_type:complete